FMRMCIGVPIISSQQGDSEGKKTCLGVLKLENKRTKWSSIVDGQFLKTIAERDNTPKAIRACILESRRNCPQYEPLLPLAAELCRCTNHIRTVIPTEKSVRNKAVLPSILPENLDANLESMRWHTECLHHQIDEIIRSSSKPTVTERRLVRMTHALRLALRTYEPFSEEDLMLARHVSAMLAAVLDIDLLVYFKGWERIAHSLNHVSSDFMEHLERIVEFHLHRPKMRECYGDLATILTSAVYISGTKGSITEPPVSKSHVPIKEACTIAQQVRSRVSAYVKLGLLRGVKVRTTESINNPMKTYFCESGQLKSGLDVLVHNAFHYGATTINLDFVQEASSLRISVRDDGVGLPDDFLIFRGCRGKRKVATSDGQAIVPSGEGMGLFNTDLSVRSFGGKLEYCNVPGGHGANFTIVLKESAV
ncbi:MAG: ATP-binding protein, partial [Verrucomicrobia bacterium]|nr:ATP-binding protein [Verrucomicrobiota bacterium]